MAFTNLNLHFPTVAAFAAWLASLPPPRWVPVGSTYHNTYIPDKAAWRGSASMDAMARTYLGKGWSTGPHVYLATGTMADGIYVMCPPTEPGVHGVTCNRDRFGIEVVGDFDRAPMGEADLALLTDVLAALHRWARIGPDVNAHRDCIARTCPGDAAYRQKPEIVRRLRALLAGPPPAPPTPPPAPYTADRLIVAPPAATLDQAIRYCLRRKHTFYAEPSIRGEILPAYWRIAAAVGVDPVVAVAQMVHETDNLSSWWSARPRRNPAGIGVTGASSRVSPSSDPARVRAGRSWDGAIFAAWDSGSIPAHVGRLLAYAVTDDRATPAQRELIARALKVRPLPIAYRGAARNLRGLGGRWAPSPTYGERIAAVAREIQGA